MFGIRVPLDVRGCFRAGLWCGSTDPWQRRQLSLCSGSHDHRATRDFLHPGAFVGHPRRRSFTHRGGPSMTKLRCFTTIGWLLLGVLVLAAASSAQTRPPIVEQLAKTYGIESFGQIEAARYTFNIAIPGLKLNLSRSWTWEPKTGQVSYEGKDKDGKP